MTEEQIWKERYQALYRWVEENCVEQVFRMITDATDDDWQDFWYNEEVEKETPMNELTDLHYERIAFLESEIRQNEQEISILKEQIDLLSNGRVYDC